MVSVLSWLDGKKTYIAAVLGLVVCVAEWNGIDVVTSVDASNAVETAYGILMAAFLRHGIAKV